MKFVVGQEELDFDEGAQLHIDPSLPYIYLPARYWEMYSLYIEDAYETAVCDSFSGVCKFT